MITVRQKICLRKAKSKQFSSNLERFQKRDSYRESQKAFGWTEDKCRHLDQIAREEKSHTATRRERQRCEKNWKLKINVEGFVSQIVKREEHLKALKVDNNLQQHAGYTKQSSGPAGLPASTEAIPRASSSRTAVELANTVKVTFLFLTGMDTIEILDLLSVEGLPLMSFFLQKGSLTGMATSLVNDGV